MKLIKLVWALVGLLSLGTGDAIPVEYQNCAPNSIATPLLVDIEPYPPRSGVDVIVNTVADIRSLVDGGTYEILGTVQIIPIIPPITVIEESGNLCDAFECPFFPGPAQNLRLVIPGDDVDIPGLGLTATITAGAVASDGSQVICIQTAIPVKNEDPPINSGLKPIVNI